MSWCNDCAHTVVCKFMPLIVELESNLDSVVTGSCQHHLSLDTMNQAYSDGFNDGSSAYKAGTEIAKGTGEE